MPAPSPTTWSSTSSSRPATGTPPPRPWRRPRRSRRGSPPGSAPPRRTGPRSLSDPARRGGVPPPGARDAHSPGVTRGRRGRSPAAALFCALHFSACRLLSCRPFQRVATGRSVRMAERGEHRGRTRKRRGPPYRRRGAARADLPDAHAARDRAAPAIRRRSAATATATRCSRPASRRRDVRRSSRAMSPSPSMTALAM